MQNEWTLPMQYGGSPCGTAVLRRDGLYYQVECICDLVTESVVRAYLECAKPVCLGVLIPDGGRLCLRRRISASQLPDPPFSAVTVASGESEWAPWSGMVCGCEITDALSRRAGAGQVIAIPYAAGEPFPYMAIFTLCSPAEIGGKTYLTVPLSD